MSALGYSVNWLEPLYVRQRLEEIADTTGCSWLISMDLDSIVREIDLPLDVILDGLAEKYGLKHGVGGVFAKEVFIQGAFTSPWHHVNASVFMTQSSVHGNEIGESVDRSLDATILTRASSGQRSRELSRSCYFLTNISRRSQTTRERWKHRLE